MKRVRPRSANALRLARQRERALALGLCGQCRARPVDPGHKSCLSCLIAFRERIVVKNGAPAATKAKGDGEPLLASATPEFVQRLRRSLARDDDDEPEVNAETAPVDLYGVPMIRAPRDPYCHRDRSPLRCTCTTCTGQSPEWIRDLPPLVPLVAEKPPKRIPFPFEGDLCVDPFGVE